MDAATEALLKAHIEKAEKKMNVAERLLKSQDYEDAVSRAYYAAFHMAQALPLTKGERAETHAGVVTLFGLFFVKPGKMGRQFGKYLVNLKDDREVGDYEALSFMDEDTARKAVLEAKEFLKEGMALLKAEGLF